MIQVRKSDFDTSLACDLWDEKKSHWKQVCFSCSCLFSFLITIYSFTNRIVTHQCLKALKKSFPAEMCLWAVIFQGFLASLLKLDPILQPFQCSWDTNPCHWSYQRPTTSMKKPHYVVIFLEEAHWFLLERPASPSTCQKPAIQGSSQRTLLDIRQDSYEPSLPHKNLILPLTAKQATQEKKGT